MKCQICDKKAATQKLAFVRAPFVYTCDDCVETAKEQKAASGFVFKNIKEL